MKGWPVWEIKKSPVYGKKLAQPPTPSCPLPTPPDSMLLGRHRRMRIRLLGRWLLSTLLLPLSIFSTSEKKNCISNLTKKDNPTCLSARGDTWLPPYSRKLSRAHQEKLVCHSFHCSCHYIGLHVLSSSFSHFQKIAMHLNLISLLC